MCMSIIKYENVVNCFLITLFPNSFFAKLSTLLAWFYQFFFDFQSQIYTFHHCSFTKYIHSTFQETQRRKYKIIKLALVS